ncbi:hypothetical protein BJ165DRAFT_1452610 [Panaeolus papilionaceus]|nr:hypothetical protein BJ165DRAFT_1452610 [Panaeolus papilionaceus]
MALVNLPLDIHISICFFLDARSILSMGQVCSHLRTVTRERTVWITTLQQTCFQNHIPNATFQLHSMSLEELQHAATAPSRILSKISLGKSRDPETEKPPVLPYVSQIILQASDLYPNIEGNYASRFFRQFILVPGGRFLVAYSHDDVILYDLNRSDLQPPHVVARVHYPDEDYTFVSAPSRDGDEIRVAMSRDRGTHIELCILRFIFDSDTPVPTVKQHTTTLHLYEQSDTLPYTLVGDVFILLYDNEDNDGDNKRTILFTWNFVEDLSVKWAVRQETYKEVFLDGERVILVTETSLQGYVLPPLRPKIDDAPIQLHDPLFGHSLISDDDFPVHATPLCIRILDWYNTSETLSSFRFIITLPPAPGEEMVSLSVQSHSDGWDVDEPEMKVSHPSLGCLNNDATEQPVDVRDISRCPFRLCDGYSVESFFVDERCLVSSTSTSHPDDQTKAIFRGVELQTLSANPFTYPHMRLSESFFAFDPFSGRLAYISNSPDLMYHSRIVVLDYLKTPEQLIAPPIEIPFI